METVIEEVEPPYRIVERGRAGRLDRIPTATVWEMVEGPASDTCEVTVTFWTGASHPVDRLREALGAERRYRRAFEHSLARLKDVLESGREVPRVAIAGGDRLPVVA